MKEPHSYSSSCNPRLALVLLVALLSPPWGKLASQHASSFHSRRGASSGLAGQLLP